MGVQTFVPLNVDELGTILDALAEEADGYGAEVPAPLEALILKIQDEHSTLRARRRHPSRR